MKEMALSASSLQHLARERLPKYTTIDSNGELVCQDGYTPDHRIRVDWDTYSLKFLSWMLYTGTFPASGRIRSSSDNPLSVDPKHLYQVRSVEIHPIPKEPPSLTDLSNRDLQEAIKALR